MKKISTFSIVAYSPDEGAWGIAVASKFPAVGAVVPWAKAGAGAVATQSYANTSFGPLALEWMENGKSAQETLDHLLAGDDQPDLRQVGLVDAQGQAATFTGEGCLSWAGGRVGKHFTAQGNILTGPETVDAMVEAFQDSSGDLPDRLIAALLAGDQAGGDRRGKQSAAIYVVRPEGGYGGYNDRWIDYRVDDHEDPIPRLVELVQMHRLYFEKSEEEARVRLTGEPLRQLQTIAQNLGYYQGAVNGEYDEPTRKALRDFIGNENFEDRFEFEKGEIDEPVLAFLLKQFYR
jgi:uncharacterized Ntn-hydrolase superfamily protein